MFDIVIVLPDLVFFIILIILSLNAGPLTSSFICSPLYIPVNLYDVIRYRTPLKSKSFSSANTLKSLVEEIDINPSDLRVDTYRASGSGGQHVNKTDSAVRLTHIPSGIVAQCQSDRSQHKNKDNAMKQLRAKLYEFEMQKLNSEKQALEDSKADIGWGSQIRSYVLDQSRIKDLRTSVETGNTQAVLDGDLDLFIEASLKSGL